MLLSKFSLMQRFSWLFVPRRLLLASAIVAAFLSCLAGYIALSLPWLGINFAAATGGHGLSVVSVDHDSPNYGRIIPGQVIVAMSDASGRSVVLNPNLLIDEPDTLSYAELKQFIDDQSLLAQIVNNSPVVTTLSGQEIRLHMEPAPLTSLFSEFAIQIAYALISLFIALGIWVVRKGQIAARFFALSGFAVLINGLPLSIYTHRDLIIDGQLFQLLSAINHAGTLLICATLVSLFWVYPRRLTRFPLLVPAFVFVAVTICWLLDFLKIGEGAGVTIYLPIFVCYVTGLIFAGWQWRASLGHPTDRAALKWCLLAIFSGTVMLIGLVTIPPAFGSSPLVPVAVGYGGFLMVYLGLAAGLLRYRLFDIERWWFKTWLWFVAGLMVLGLDLLLIFFVNMTTSTALAVSLALSGWLYFPLRQLLWQKLGRHFSASQDDALRKLVDLLFAAKSEQQIITIWPYLLSHTFKPLLLQDYEDVVKEVEISTDGVRMLMPALKDGGKPQVLEFPEEGGRLFSPQDLHLASLIYDLTSKALQGLREREAGAEAERSRIMRDLHDDLGARLLSLVYASDTPASRDIALAAIDDLRGLVNAASGDSAQLRGLITTCEGEARTRLENAGLTLEWSLVGRLPDNMVVSARAVSNIMRTLREGVTNVIRHAQADRVEVKWQVESNSMTISITDNGETTDIQAWAPGHGTRTIHTRTGDLGGKATWLPSQPRGCQLEISLPLPL